MDYSKIKDLIKTIEESSLIDFELKVKGEFYIRMNKAVSKGEFTPCISSESSKSAVEIKEINFDNTAKDDISEPMTIIPEDKVEVKEGNIVSSPMVGTFYRSKAPEKPPFVKEGDKVKKGDVLCIIEAMKIMNEITSEFDGIVAEIMAENQDMVEYGQPLVRIV